MLLPNFYHPFFLYCVKTPTNDDGNFGELEFLCTFVAKSKPLSKTRQSIANRTVSKSLPEHQPIVRNTLLQRVVAFLSKVTKNSCKPFINGITFRVSWAKVGGRTSADGLKQEKVGGRGSADGLKQEKVAGRGSADGLNRKRLAEEALPMD